MRSNLRCLDCGAEYLYLGSPPHKGVCPNCGSEAVPAAPPVEIREAEPLGDPRDDDAVTVTDRQTIRVTLADQTGREIRAVLTVDWEASSAMLAFVRVGDQCVSATALEIADILPETCLDQLASDLGLALETPDAYETRSGVADA